MASEAARGIIRMGSNYGRQGLSLVLNILLVALLFAWLGEDGYGLWALITVTVGTAALVDEVMRHALIRELAQAYHRRDDAYFRGIYNAASILCIAGALICGVIFAVVIAFIDVLNIKPHLVGAARAMLALEGGYTCLFLILAPATNMFQVQERFVAFNIWTTLRRFTMPIAAIVFYKLIPISDVARGAVAFVSLYTALNTLLVIGAAGLIISSSRLYLPAPWRATRPALREIFGTFSWMGAVSVALTLYERIPAFIMNFFFGLTGSAVYGFAITMASYIRMLAEGINSGLDAVAARIRQHDQDQTDRLLAHFTRTYTMLHALMAVPGAIAMLILTEPIVRLWIGPRVQDPAILPPIMAMVPLLILPVLVRAISDCWVRILYGAGYIRRIAPIILLGGLLNPVAALLLYWLLPTRDLKFQAPAISFAVVFTFFQMLLLPAVAARALHLSWFSLISPALRPLALGIATSPILLVANALVPTHTIVTLAAACALYGGVYMALAVPFVLPPDQRRRFAAAARRRLGLHTQDPITPPAPHQAPATAQGSSMSTITGA